MGTTSKQRKDARRHQQRNKHRQVFGHATEAPSLEQLMLAGACVAFGSEADERLLDMHVEQLARLDPDVDSAGSAAGMLQSLLSGLWEQGWQPMDLVHVVRRAWPQRIVRLVVAVIAQNAHANGASSRAPEEWAAQLRAIGADSRDGAPAVNGWCAEELLSASEGWRDALRLLGQLGVLPALEVLSPPPSQWGVSQRTRDAAGAVEPKTLAKIRGLLAKAESTDFPEEAEALTAKAQDLMTRYAIDVAVLHAEQGSGLAGDVRARRVHIDRPYPDGKVQLLDSVARANAVRVIWFDALGIASVVGLPTDLDLVEMLFTSLLVQATRGMSEAGPGSNNRSRGFRRAFLLSYATRIGERLKRSSEHANEEASRTYGAALVPVLRERTEAVDEVFAQMFPDVVVKRSRPVDRAGWYAGRAAADRADLGAPRDQLAQ